jgi:outer membrane biosynthesis protein TonB
MNRWSIILLALMACAGVAFAQSSAPQASQNGQMLSSDLIAWSFMQEPQQPEQSRPQQQPTPEPNPETQPAQNPTPAQPGEQQPAPSASQSQTSTAQTFTGTIDKESDSYVLKVSDSTSYKLDNAQQVQSYEGQRVQVTGTLDRAINLIHVDKVEPIS